MQLSDVNPGTEARRVELVRTLLQVGDLGPAEVQRVLGLLDSPDTSLGLLLAAVQYSLPAAGSASDDDAWTRAEERARALARARNWQVGAANPAWSTVIQSLVVLEWLGQDELLELLVPYAEALEKVAESELRLVVRQPDPESAAARMVAASVIGDTLIGALRRLAHEHALSGMEVSGPPLSEG